MQIGAIWSEDVGCDRFKASCTDNEMDVRRAVRVPAHLAKQLSDGAVVGDRVEFRPDRFEPIRTVGIRGENTPKVHLRLKALLLNIIKALIIGLPNVEHSSRNRPPLRVRYAAG